MICVEFDGRGGGQENLTPMWMWENGMQFERNTIQFMVHLAAEEALTPSLAPLYTIGSYYSLDGALIKQYPPALLASRTAWDGTSKQQDPLLPHLSLAA